MFVHGVALLGVLILIANYIGLFAEQNRLNLFNKLTTEPYRAELNFPGVSDFLRDYYNPARANDELKTVPLKGILLTWITIGGNKPMAGNVHLWLEGDKKSTSLATLDELRQWATQTPGYSFVSFVSFVLIILSVFGNILLDIIPFKRNRLAKMLPKLLVFASGTKDAGGSGFQNLVEWSRKTPGSFEVVGVVSNHENGGVRKRADALGIPFIHFDPSQHPTIVANGGMSYQKIVEESGTDYVTLSGWMKHTDGLPSAKTINIHPALLSQLGGPFDGLRASRFGGAGMYGLAIHEAVKEAFEKGEIKNSGLSMHFVTDTYDGGPVFFEYPVPLDKGMTAIDIRERVNAAEHEWQPKITNMVVHGEISWDGHDPKSLKVPEGYQFLPRVQ